MFWEPCGVLLSELPGDGWGREIGREGEVVNGRRGRSQRVVRAEDLVQLMRGALEESGDPRSGAIRFKGWNDHRGCVGGGIGLGYR